jgi:hypothetical protein
VVADCPRGGEVIGRTESFSGLPHVDVRVVLEELTLLLEQQDPIDGFVDARRADLSAAHGVEDGVVRDVERHGVRWRVDHHQHVNARLEGQDGDAVVPVLLTDAGHVQRVGDDDAVVAELATQEPSEDLRGKRRRVAAFLRHHVAVGLQLWHNHMGGHHHVRTGSDTGGERWCVDGVPLLLRVEDPRHTGVAVGDGVAVSGEVLEGRRNVRPLAPCDRGRGQVGDQLWVLSERADADHGVERVDVDISDRRVVLVDAECAQLLSGDVRRRVGVERPAGRTQRHAPRELRRRSPHPRDHAVFLVGRDEQRDRGTLAERHLFGSRWTTPRSAPAR